MVGVAAAAVVSLPALGTNRVGIGDARRVHALIDHFVASDQTAGGATVLSDALTALNRANKLLETCDFESSAAEDGFTRAVGKLAIRVGWLAYDCDKPDLARRCYAEALALANVAGDNELTIHGCANSAMLAISTGAAGRARRFASRATDLTHGLPPGRIHALLAVREATAYAAIGDSSAFGRSIASAWREMDRAFNHEPLDNCPAWLRFMSHAEVLYHEAKGNGLLGHHDGAVTMYGRVAAEHTSTPRNAANYRATLAAEYAAIGDATSAQAEGTTALHQLGGTPSRAGIASPRALRLLDPVRELLGDRPGADSFTDHYEQVARQMAVVA